MRKIKENGEKTLRTGHHDAKKISRAMQNIKQEASHHCWDGLFGWSPKAAGIVNALILPIIVLLILVSRSLILSIAILTWNWRMLRLMAVLNSLPRAYGIAFKDTYCMTRLDGEETVH